MALVPKRPIVCAATSGRGWRWSGARGRVSWCAAAHVPPGALHGMRADKRAHTRAHARTRAHTRARCIHRHGAYTAWERWACSPIPQAHASGLMHRQCHRSSTRGARLSWEGGSDVDIHCLACMRERSCISGGHCTNVRTRAQGRWVQEVRSDGRARATARGNLGPLTVHCTGSSCACTRG